MIVDLNAYLGHWPFRQLRHNSAGGLLKLMVRHGIDMAVVSSLSAIFYKNTQPGNEELAKQMRRHRDRLIPWGVVNPTYADWEQDLAVCVEEFGMSGLRLYPNSHGYRLGDAACTQLVNAASERGLLLSIPIRVTDPRQSHWLFEVPTVDLSDVVALVKKHPKARFVLVNGAGYASSPLGQKDNGLPPNYFIEISRLTAVMGAEIKRLMDTLGKERVVFGTGMPMKSPEPPLVKMEVLSATKREKERVLWRNAKALLGQAGAM